MLDPEDDPQPVDPPENTTGSGGGKRADSDVDVDSANALKPLDPPENQGGGG